MPPPLLGLRDSLPALLDLVDLPSSRIICPNPKQQASVTFVMSAASLIPSEGLDIFVESSCLCNAIMGVSWMPMSEFKFGLVR